MTAADGPPIDGGDGPPPREERLEATIRGRVQGVGFRYFVVLQARDLGLAGWVANEGDGSVRCLAEGSPAALDRFEAALRIGPPGAIVETVIAARMPATGRFDRFAIRSGAHSGD
jgi:acylphosphatase